MNRAAFYDRISGLLDPNLLQTKKVAVIGLGSGGSRVAAGLGRLGVNLFLIERPGELLEEHNIVRHVLGYGALGKPKLTEMRRHICNLNASVSVDCCSLDVVAQQELLTKRLKEWRPPAIPLQASSCASQFPAGNHGAEKQNSPRSIGW